MKHFTIGMVCLVWIILTPSVYADNPQKRTDANLMGHVLDKRTGEHLSFINIIVRGTMIGTSTDATGHYFLKDLPVGKCILEFKSIGYKTVTREVVMEPGKTLEVNVDMEEDQVLLDGVVVSANRVETTRRLAPSLVNVLDVGGI